MSDKIFRLYVIKNKSNDKYFTGVTSSENNLMYWLLRQYKSDNKKYTELGESINEFGIKNHVYSVVKTFNDKEEADKQNFTLQTNLQKDNKLINSMIINPERAVCIGCGYKIRKVFMEKHLEFCKNKINDEINKLLLSEDSDNEESNLNQS